MTMKKRYGFILLLLLIFAGALIPETPQVPVHQASAKDWHKDSFWYYPWGTSGVHKGIDIFAARGTQVQAPTPMLRLYQGEWRLGGKVVLALGPGWKLHYFAHLDSLEPNGLYLPQGSKLGTVGDSGNAKGKPPHLHYSIVSLMPMPWLMDDAPQGYKKAFYLNPVTYLAPR